MLQNCWRKLNKNPFQGLMGMFELCCRIDLASETKSLIQNLLEIFELC